MFGRIASRSRKVIFYSSLVRTHPECCARFWTALYESDVDMLERVQWQAIMIFKRLEHLWYDKGLRDLCLLILKKRRLKEIIGMYTNI